MESASVAAGGAVPPKAGGGESGPALKKNAITFISNIVIGVASTAPGYSLAVTLGLVVAVAGLGVQSPAIMIVAFVPMLFIASAYYYMNRADPDCGTTFSWVTKAMGPSSGWMGGWAIIVADILVMPTLSQIAGIYSFKLFDSGFTPTTAEVTAVGVAWIIVMTAICYIGIELSARTQQYLLGMEFATLVAFAIVALIKVYTSHPKNSIHPAFSWFNPLDISSTTALVDGVLLAIFIYWGWDSGVTVNEETKDSSTAPGRAAIISTIILVGIYVVVTTAAQAYGGTQNLIDNANDVFANIGHSVFGSPFDKILIIAVLTSASASTQTTILPTARTSLSMARARALPGAFGKIHPRYLSPSVSTLAMGGVSIVVYVGLTLISSNIIVDCVSALGLMIAFYYGITGFACVIFYRRELFRSVKNFLFVGVLPTLGGLMLGYAFVKSSIDLSKKGAGSGVVLGLGSPFVIGIGGLLLGAVLMLIWRGLNPEFFRRKTEVAHPALLDATPAGGGGA